MGRQKSNIHYIYKTTCLITGRYYIGMHSTTNIDDGYLGSGKRLRYSIRKYGKENHQKEILEMLPTRELLILREIEIVTKELMFDKKCMNLKEGGTGGWLNYETQLKCSKAGGKAYGEKVKTDKNYRELALKKLKKALEKISELGINYTNKRFEGKNHSDNTKKILSEKAKKRIGSKSSQYGTCWITKDGSNKKIKKDILNDFLIQGWILGRNMTCCNNGMESRT